MEGAFVMKYMTFNASCAYAGLANIPERFGIETEDREIALAMGLPYFFAKEGEYTVKVLPLARGNRAVKMSSPAHFARQASCCRRASSISGSQGNSHGGNQSEQGGCRWNREVVGFILDF